MIARRRWRPAQSLVAAYLEIVSRRCDDPIIPLRFNPTEYQLAEGEQLRRDRRSPGLESPPIQFVRGAAEKLTLDLLRRHVRHAGGRARARTSTSCAALMDINNELHAPPIVRLVWDQQVFTGVIEC